MFLENYKKFIKYYGKGRYSKLLGFAGLSLIAGIMELVGVAMIYPFIILIMTPETIMEHVPQLKLINPILLGLSIGLCVLLLFILKNFFMILVQYIQSKFITNWKKDIAAKFMEYYIYACYFEPQQKILMPELPIAEYYRTYADLCVKLQKYKRAEDAYKKALCWNPVDLDSYLGLAECYKYLNMMSRYLDVTKQAYRFCCTRATMARYYRNMGFYYLSSYNTDMAKACYTYSNIYYHTDNADSELNYIENALKEAKDKGVTKDDKEYDIRTMQAMFDKENVEPGPDSKTIGIVYRVGELMLQDKEYALAKDCFSIVYDITNEQQLEGVLAELDRCLENA